MKMVMFMVMIMVMVVDDVADVDDVDDVDDKKTVVGGLKDVHGVFAVLHEVARALDWVSARPQPMLRAPTFQQHANHSGRYDRLRSLGMTVCALPNDLAGRTASLT